MCIRDRVTLEYSMRVNFEGEPARWFEVENYVKFLCDHVRSVLKGAIKKVSIEAFYGASVEIIRDTMLGKAGDGGARTGMRFAENGTNLETVRPYFPADPAPDLGGIGLTSRHFVVQGRLRQGDRVLEERSLVQRRQLEVVVLQREHVNLRDGS